MSVVNTVLTGIKAHRSIIFLGLGLGLGAACVISTAVQTVKASDIIFKANSDLDDVDAREEANESLPEANESLPEPIELDANKERKIIRKNTTIALVKTYAVPVVLGLGSVGCILASYRILSGEKAAAIAALSSVSAAFDKYRERVRDKYGVEEDYNIYMGKEEVETEIEVTDPKTGKTKKKKIKETKLNPIDDSCYTRVFSSVTSKEWCFNQERLIQKLEWFNKSQNDRLKKKGRMSFNEVCQELGLDCSVGYYSTERPVPEGIGWLSQEILDAVSDRFPGPYDSVIKYMPKIDEGYFDDGCTHFDGAYLLKFNCYPIDSMVEYYQQKLERGEITH